MAIGIILGILFVIFFIVCVIVLGYCFSEEKLVGVIISAIAGLALIIGFILVPFSFHTIDAGEVAVVKYLGEAKDVRTAGTYFDLWVTNKYQKYDAKVQNVDIATSAYSSDAQTMDIQMTLQYQIKSECVMDITNQYGSLDILQNRIQSIAIEKAKSTLSSYKAMDIIADRSAMSPAVEDAIKNSIGEEYFVNIIAVVITDISFSDAFEIAVEEKMIAEQNQLKASYENETKIAKAETDATVKITNAEAAAKANELLEQSLTEEILRQMFINKWDGKLPEVMSGEDSLSIMLPISETTTTTTETTK